MNHLITVATVLLDTNVVIRHLRGKRATVQAVRQLSRRQRLAIAVVTRLEIHAGMHDAERFATRKLLTRFLTYPLDLDIADLAGDLIADQRRRGQTIAVPDAMIAATALVHQCWLFTFNQAHFVEISGLRLLPLPDES